MERAGRAVALEILGAFPESRRVGVVCGGGANGGDGKIAARLLREAGVDAVETDAPEGFDLVVDALFGTGFHGEPRPEAAALIDRINACGAPVVAVDLPSGVDASTGEIAGHAVEATCTVTFHGRKLGHHVAPGRFHTGRLVVADIGLAAEATAARRVLPAILGSVPARGARDTKYSSGSVLIVGRLPGNDGCCRPHGEGSAARGRRIRHPVCARGVRPGRRDAGGRAGEGRVTRPRRARRRPSPCRACSCGCDRARSRTGTCRSRARRSSSLEPDLSGRDRCGRALRARAVRARGTDGAHPARRRARPAARTSVGLGLRRIGSKPSPNARLGTAR